MGMFDYKNYFSEESAKLVDDASRLSTYTNALSVLALYQSCRCVNLVGKLTGDLFPNKYQCWHSDGWAKLGPLK